MLSRLVLNRCLPVTFSDARVADALASPPETELTPLFDNLAPIATGAVDMQAV
jgi:hypothetical protein